MPLKRLLPLLILFCLCCIKAKAQSNEAPYISWDDFVQSYLESSLVPSEDQEGDEADLRERLENISQNPLQINLLQRKDLLQFPFIDEAQADSILSYREQKRGFVSLGELQLIKGIDYYARAYLSLFLRCDSLYSANNSKYQYHNIKIKNKLYEGKHELESRLDIPFYQRAGYAPKDAPSNTNWYAGNSLHHVVRYRYHYGREVFYGLTFEKDAGEPVCKQGFYPYDYLSGYLLLRSKDKPWSFVLGDFNLYETRGLLLGKRQFGGKAEQLKTLQRPVTSFTAHTSADESRYFRGLAASYKLASFIVTAYASYRKLDGRLNQNGDTVQTLLTTGLHRTLSEINSRRTLGSLTAGMNVAYNANAWGVSLGSVYTHFNRTISPPQRAYNQYYFRGTSAVGSAATYYVKFGKMVGVGEWAIDKKGHMAVENALSYNFSSQLKVSIQQRHFSPRFVSLNGRALQQGSRVANEQGLVFSVHYVPKQQFDLLGYVDCFRFPKSTYNAYFDGTHGVEAMLQSTYSPTNVNRFLFRYQVKQKQYNYTYNNRRLLESRVTHKVRLSSSWNHSTYNCTLQADASYVRHQSGEQHWGTMLSTRAGWNVNSHLNIKGLLSLFYTDDYESRLYVYEPQLLHAAGFNSFADAGWHGVMLANWQCLKLLTLSLRFSTLCYFNRKSISSGTELISSSWKNDLSLQLHFEI